MLFGTPMQARHLSGSSHSQLAAHTLASLQMDFALQKNRQSMGRRYIEVFRSKKVDYYAASARPAAHGSERRL